MIASSQDQADAVHRLDGVMRGDRELPPAVITVDPAGDIDVTVEPWAVTRWARALDQRPLLGVGAAGVEVYALLGAHHVTVHGAGTGERA